MKGIGLKRLGKCLAAALVCWVLLGSGSGEVLAARSERLRSAHLTLYKEAHQGAFYMLIPKGWKAEGGMIPSGVEWNVVDLVENNIRFRVTSPDGMSFFGWYPRFYFQDPQTIAVSSGGMLQPQAGQVLNGCWLFPYLNVSQYVQYIILNQLSAAEFQQPRILGNYILRDENDGTLPVENAAEWRQLKIINRNDPGYRSTD